MIRLNEAKNVITKIICRQWSTLSLILGVLLLPFCVSAQAQQPKKAPRIGYLTPAFRSANAARIEAFRLGLRELGYVEGKNIVIEYRYAEGKLDRLHALATELVRLQVDVIVTGGDRSTRAAKEATSTIPIVMTQDPDPVGNGLVASLARPGGNITGLSNFVSDLSGKRLQLLKEIVPKISRVSVFGTSTNPGNANQLRETELASDGLALNIQYLNVIVPKDIEIAFRAATTKFEFIINLKAANQINLRIPDRVLERANKVIK